MEKLASSDLTFAESWKGKEVEMAAAATLVVGAGALAARGHSPDVIRYGQKAMKNAGGAAERYFKRRVNPAVRFGYDTVKKTIVQVKKAPKLDSSSNFDDVLAKHKDVHQNISDNDIKKLAQRKMNDHFKDFKFETNKKKELDPTYKIPDYEGPSIVEMEERARQELFEQAQKNKFNGMDGGKPKQKPIFTKREVAENVVGSGIAGLAFGGGISLFHALDDSSGKKKNQTYEAAGTYYEPRKGKNMNKQAGFREIHDGVGNFAGKIPGAVASGIGFTGVSLGTAAALKKRQEDQNKQNGEKSRIIIEFGEDSMEGPKEMPISSTGLAMLPRPDLHKQASVNRFLKNLGGRRSEIKKIEDEMASNDYHEMAAQKLKNSDVASMAKEQYGHVFNEERAKEQLLNSYADKLKGLDKQRSESIKNEVAAARVPTFGGIGLAGAGIGMHKMRSEKDDMNG